MLDAMGHKAARMALVDLGALGALHQLEREIQTRHALALLQSGCTRPQARDRLKCAHGVTRKTAYRRINDAIDRRGSTAHERR